MKPAYDGIQRLVLLGAGHAHLHVLTELARQRPASLDVTLVTPHGHQTYSGMVPGFVAGRYALAQCQIGIETLAARAGVQWLRTRCERIDAQAQRVHLAGAPDQPLAYDRLSIDVGSVLERDQIEQQIPGAAGHALRTRPLEQFVALWPRVQQLALQRPLSLAVIGAGAAGVELAFAAQQGLPGSRVSLVTGGPEVLENFSPVLRQRVLRRLKRANITVLREACFGVGDGQVRLANGAALVCDVPLLALTGQAPRWLTRSGLELADTGHVLVNEQQASVSHPNVFAAGDVATRVDHPHPKSGVYAVRAGPVLAYNLLAEARGLARKSYRPRNRALSLLSCGSAYAVAGWGEWSLEGRWAWLWKDWIDRRFVRRYGAMD